MTFLSLPVFWPDPFVASSLIFSKSSFIIYIARYFNLPSSIIPADFLIIFNTFLIFYSFCGLNLFSVYCFRHSDSKRCRISVFLLTWWVVILWIAWKQFQLYVLSHDISNSGSLELLGLIWQCGFLSVSAFSSASYHCED